MLLRRPGRRRPGWAAALFALQTLAVAPAAVGQNVEDILPLSDLEDDPIGIDRRVQHLEEGGRPEQAAPPPERMSDDYGPNPPPYRARRGRALTGIAALREVHHRVSASLTAGYARLEVEQLFESSSGKPAEIRYRLPLPSGATLASLQVCNTHGCRAGRMITTGGLDAYDSAVHARGPGEPVPPAARARIVATKAGAAVELHAAPVSRELPLTVQLSISAPAPLHAGMVRLELPARGMDPRAAPTSFRVTAAGLLDIRIDGRPAPPGDAGFATERDPWVASMLSARAPSGGAPRLTATHYPCDDGRCAELLATAGPQHQPPRPVSMILALDVSPSTEGPARNRAPAAIAALLAAAPTGSIVRSLIFSGRARALMADASTPDRVPLAPFGRAAREAELGSATRLEAALEVARDLWQDESRKKTMPPRKRLLVVIGDGGITTSTKPEGARRDPFMAAKRAGIEVAVVNLADRATHPTLRRGAQRTGGAVVEAGREAATAIRGRSAAPLEERLNEVYARVVARRVVARGAGAPVTLAALRAGHEVRWRGPLRRASGVLQAGNRRVTSRARGEQIAASTDPRGKAVALLAVARLDTRGKSDDWPEAPAIRPQRRDGKPRSCDRRGPALRASGLSSDAQPVELATHRRCQPKPKPVAKKKAELGAGMPASPLLEMLRRRIIPVARGCFRRDRGGRPDYAVRAVFRFRLADREVVSAAVAGRIPEALRECLLRAVDGLLVPRFNGTVIVSYPLHTERQAMPTTVKLTTEAQSVVDDLLSTP